RPETHQAHPAGMEALPLDQHRCDYSRVQLAGQVQVVTDQGIAVNPARPELYERFVQAGLPVTTIEKLRDRAERIAGKPESIKYGDKIVGVLMYRDNTVLDVIREVID
ncbi:MAG: citrate lyase subunit alpha, partial [Clostridia bacterium]|nr:citrate lyase subunit alpha [Clostridia bacterium]